MDVIAVDLTIPEEVEFQENVEFDIDENGQPVFKNNIREEELVRQLEVLLKKGSQGSIELRGPSMETFYTYYLVENKILKQGGRVVYDGAIQKMKEVNELEFRVYEDKDNDQKGKLKNKLKERI